MVCYSGYANCRGLGKLVSNLNIDKILSRRELCSAGADFYRYLAEAYPKAFVYTSSNTNTGYLDVLT